MKTVASLPLSEAGVGVKSGSALVLSRARPRPLPIPRITPRLGPSIAICDAEYAPPRLLQYFNEPPSRLSRCQVRRRIALNIAKLPELTGRAKNEAPSRLLGAFGNSIEHHRVVDVVRGRQILCTDHHRKWIDGRTSKRTGRSPCSDANPCSNANQEQHSNTGENADLAHVNPPLHSAHRSASIMHHSLSRSVGM